MILVHERGPFLRTALLSQGRLVHLWVEPCGPLVRVGEVYLGIVKSLARAQKAAFLDLGDGQSGYLPLRGGPEPRVGDALTVQIQRSPCGEKKAKVSRQIVLSEDALVLKKGEGVALAKDVKRNRFLKEHGVKTGHEGFLTIYRAGANYCDRAALEGQEEKLVHAFRALEGVERTRRGPGRLWRPEPQALSLARRLRNRGLSFEVWTNEAAFSKEITAYGPKTVHLLPKESSPLADLGVEEEILALRSARVPLPGGGNLCIQETEAMAVIDVNGGAQGGNLEPLGIAALNEEALKEALRQIRLRNLSGLIVLDCVEMEEESAQAFFAKAQALCRAEDVHTRVYPLTSLQRLEISRQKKGLPLSKTLFQAPPPGALPLSREYLLYLLMAHLRVRGDGAQKTTVTLQAEYERHRVFLQQALTQEWPGVRLAFKDPEDGDSQDPPLYRMSARWGEEPAKAGA
ncbi:Cytoplasmic axial filament protein CafA and Ribonuclease G [Clostridiaceae bacterium JG1575]|nr:Cytoplasmic axial filament protein CafA and Ribonuclease G [Clostridiaceae bacterium JG1575]